MFLSTKHQGPRSKKGPNFKGQTSNSREREGLSTKDQASSSREAPSTKEQWAGRGAEGGGAILPSLRDLGIARGRLPSDESLGYYLSSLWDFIRDRSLLAVILGVICLGLADFQCVGAETNAPANSPAAFAVAARKDFAAAEKRYLAEPNNPEAAWQFGRACFDAADYSTNSTERADLAEKGMAACHKLLEEHPDSAPGHYYLAMDMGQLARTKTLGALRLVNLMEQEFYKAKEIDQNFDYAGPDRNLGLLYRNAPSLASIGDRSKAREHLQLAAKLAPNYPGNRLNLVESYVEWNERDNARAELKGLEAILPSARTNLSGPQWASSWADWDARLKQAHKKLDSPPAPAGGKNNN